MPFSLTDGSLLKAGTSIVAGCHFMQRDPDYFPDPDAFKPERFLEERPPERNSAYEFVPFSAGKTFESMPYFIPLWWFSYT